MIQIAVALIVFLCRQSVRVRRTAARRRARGDLEKVRALIDEGAEIDAQSERGETPLILATWRGKRRLSSF